MPVQKIMGHYSLIMPCTRYLRVQVLSQFRNAAFQIAKYGLRVPRCGAARRSLKRAPVQTLDVDAQAAATGWLWLEPIGFV